MEKLLIWCIGNYLNTASYFSKTYAAGKAINLFSKPRRGQITTTQRAFLNTSISNSYSFNGYLFNTYQWGQGSKTILLAHGWESNAGRWRLFIESLIDLDVTIIAIDAPAHGHSTAKEFNALIYADYINLVVKDINPDVIIGHSVGGMASVFYLNKYNPDYKGKLILLGAPSEFKNVFKNYTDLLGYNKRVVNALDYTIKARFGKKPEEFSGAEQSQVLKHTSSLIIHDKEDQIISVDDSYLYASNMINNQLIHTKGFGHGLNKPEIVSMVRTFITT